jgi:hypothetical protein
MSLMSTAINQMINPWQIFHAKEYHQPCAMQCICGACTMKKIPALLPTVGFYKTVTVLFGLYPFTIGPFSLPISASTKLKFISILLFKNLFKLWHPNSLQNAAVSQFDNPQPLQETSQPNQLPYASNTDLLPQASLVALAPSVSDSSSCLRIIPTSSSTPSAHHLAPPAKNTKTP